MGSRPAIVRCPALPAEGIAVFADAQTIARKRLHSPNLDQQKGVRMKKFLAIYTGSAASFDKWKTMDEDQRKQKEKAGKEAWGKWVTANQASIVDTGSPVGKTKRISAQGISDIRNEIGAYTIVQAESHEAAAKLFEKHPHFMIFPGEGVEVMECLPMPEM
jgi:hypothetical protein